MAATTLEETVVTTVFCNAAKQIYAGASRGIQKAHVAATKAKSNMKGKHSSKPNPPSFVVVNVYSSASRSSLTPSVSLSSGARNTSGVAAPRIVVTQTDGSETTLVKETRVSLFREELSPELDDSSIRFSKELQIAAARRRDSRRLSVHD